jgi:aspartate/methionine/tyrosine aminotransferase
MFSRRVPESLAPNALSSMARRLASSGAAIIDLTESNPTRSGIPYPVDLLAPLGDVAGLRYDPQPFGLAAARRAVARDFARRGIRVEGAEDERIVLTASTSEAYSLLFKLLCDPGDSVLVPRPSYPLFDHLCALDAVRLIPYELEFHGAWSIDTQALARTAESATRAILVVSPNNPTGSFVTRADLEWLAAFCADRGMALVGDEVFADYVLADAAGGPSVLEQDAALAFSLGGLSKSVGLPQIKLAWMAVAGPEILVRDALQRLELVCDTYLSVSTPVQLAAPRLLEAGRSVREAIADRVRGNYRALCDAAVRWPACRVLPAEGGWYAVVQVPATVDEETLVVGLLERDRILVHPGYFFDFPREAFVIVSLLPPRATFTPAVSTVLARCAS